MPDLDPPYLLPDHHATVLRSPSKALVVPPAGLNELTGPAFGTGNVRCTDADLTVHRSGEAVGERIIVHGTVRDGSGVPVRRSLVEVWQANAAGRYQVAEDLGLAAPVMSWHAEWAPLRTMSASPAPWRR